MVKDQRLVIPHGRCSEWSLLANADRVYLGRMSCYLADAVAAVGCDAVSVSLLAVSHSYDPLGVSVPCYIVDPAADNEVLALGDRRLANGSFAVPHSYSAGNISAGNVEA